MRKFHMHLVAAAALSCMALTACTTTGTAVLDPGASAAVTEAGLSVFITLENQRLDVNVPDAATARKYLGTLDTEYAVVTVGRIAFDASQAAHGAPLDPALLQSRATVDDGYFRLRARLSALAGPS
jgi:hypothetical protein